VTWPEATNPDVVDLQELETVEKVSRPTNLERRCARGADPLPVGERVVDVTELSFYADHPGTSACPRNRPNPEAFPGAPSGKHVGCMPRGHGCWAHEPRQSSITSMLAPIELKWGLNVARMP
jgi:hypothetical protein